MFLLVLLVFVTFLYLLYYYFTRNYKYWQSRNIKGPSPIPIFGNLKDFVLRKSNALSIHKNIYDEYPNEKVVGFYRMRSPALLIRDLDIVKNILIKDFEYFEDRGIEYSKEGLGANLFHADADIWRPLRNFFSPLFTTAKLKNMSHLIVERSDIYINYYKEIVKTQKDLDVYSLFKKITISAIMACAFGVDIDLDNNVVLEKMTKIDKMSFERTIFYDIDVLFPGLFKKLNASILPEEITDFFLDMVKDIIKTRNGIPSNRKDFIDLILEAINRDKLLEAKIGDCEKNGMENTVISVKLTNEVIAAQAFVFYVAGYETNTSTLTFMLYELAMNPDIQDKLIAEVDEVLNRYKGRVEYDMINELPYMEKVFNETLRKYPVADIQRRAKTNYKIPGTEIIIEKGTIVFISSLGISQDKKYFTNPTKFDPERFSPENESKRHACAFIPFGVGPRFCIGMLFARMQSRIILTKLLATFRVEPREATAATISIDPGRVTSAPLGGLRLKLIPRK